MQNRIPVTVLSGFLGSVLAPGGRHTLKGTAPEPWIPRKQGVDQGKMGPKLR